MMNILAIFACCLCMLSMIPGSSAVCHRRVCYHFNGKRPENAKLAIENIDPLLCTHLIFILPCENKNCTMPFSTEDEGLFLEFEKWKVVNPKLKTLAAFGAWITGGTNFNRIASTAAARKVFIKQAIQFLRKHNFDGLDLFWFDQRVFPTNEKQMFKMLVQELRAAFEEESARSSKPRLLISTFLPYESDDVKAYNDYDVPTISQEVDMFNVHTFNMHEIWYQHTAHTSPLYFLKGVPSWYTRRSVDSVLKLYVKLGVAKEKINVGLTTKARSFTLTNSSKNGVNAKQRGPGAVGKYLAKPGQLTYYEVCGMIAGGATVRRIDDQRVPYLVMGDQWVGYEDQMSIMQKVNYINLEGYGGYMIWMLDYDDFTGVLCAQGTYPLANAAKELCHDTMGEINLSSPENPDDIRLTTEHQCDPGANNFYPNPNDPSTAFLCWQGKAFHLDCQEGQEFNPVNKTCQ